MTPLEQLKSLKPANAVVYQMIIRTQDGNKILPAHDDHYPLSFVPPALPPGRYAVNFFDYNYKILPRPNSYVYISEHYDSGAPPSPEPASAHPATAVSNKAVADTDSPTGKRAAEPEPEAEWLRMAAEIKSAEVSQRIDDVRYRLYREDLKDRRDERHLKAARAEIEVHERSNKVLRDTIVNKDVSDALMVAQMLRRDVTALAQLSVQQAHQSQDQLAALWEDTRRHRQADMDDMRRLREELMANVSTAAAIRQAGEAQALAVQASLANPPKPTDMTALGTAMIQMVGTVVPAIFGRGITAGTERPPTGQASTTEVIGKATIVDSAKPATTGPPGADYLSPKELIARKFASKLNGLSEADLLRVMADPQAMVEFVKNSIDEDQKNSGAPK